jgi:[calcium/calmodulin-dependent protein kinase] kinase
VLLNDAGRCHLTDFGCAKAFGSSNGGESVLQSDTVGTYQFLAPECCSGDPYDPFKVDIWAVGVMLFIFLFGRLPFTSESTRELFDAITRADVVLPAAEESNREVPLSPEGQDLLLRLLEKDPEQRITIAEALRHQWLAQDEDDEEPLSF